MEKYLEQGMPQMTIRRMRTAWWIPKATNTHTLIIIAVQLQQWLHEGA